MSAPGADLGQALLALLEDQAGRERVVAALVPVVELLLPMLRGSGVEGVRTDRELRDVISVTHCADDPALAPKSIWGEVERSDRSFRKLRGRAGVPKRDKRGHVFTCGEMLEIRDQILAEMAGRRDDAMRMGWLAKINLWFEVPADFRGVIELDDARRHKAEKGGGRRKEAEDLSEGHRGVLT